MRFYSTFLNLLQITFLFILLKIFLQFFLGTIFESPPFPYNSLSIFNLKYIIFEDGFINYIILIVYYEFLLFFCAYYFWIFTVLFFIILKAKKNLIITHTIYLLCIYLIACYVFNNQKIEFIGILTTIILSTFNWYLFHKLLFNSLKENLNISQNN